MSDRTIIQAIITLKAGGIIAYPTEAVYGLGCDPFNEQAVLKLLALKQRDIKKGLILIAATWDQVQTLAQKIPATRLKEILEISERPITWIFPANLKAPPWICGEHETIALRITAHPLAKNLCSKFGGPIVSTSANLEGQKPTRNKMDVLNQFPQGINLIVDGETGSYKNPSEIRDAITGKILRPG